MLDYGSMERRVLLEGNTQRDLFLSLKNKHSLATFSKSAGVPYSTLKNYACSQRLLPESLFLELLAFLDLNLKNFSVSYLPPFWGRSKGGKKGMHVLMRKYPGKLVEWRKKANAQSVVVQKKKISFPPLNEQLAEFIGIYLGDGTLTPYFLKITGDSRYDIRYFDYIEKLVLDLFGLSVSRYISPTSHSTNLVVFSRELCSFLNREYGFAYGDKLKNNTLIPGIILKAKSLSFACLRGLVDTDGSVSRRGTNGEQFSLSFFSGNKNLIRQVKRISDPYTLFTYVSKNEDEIGTNRAEKIISYFRLIGSSNLRHIVRFYERMSNRINLYQREVVLYYQQPFYRDIKLPFRVKGPIG